MLTLPQGICSGFRVAMIATLLLSCQTLASAQQVYYVDSTADNPNISATDKDGRVTLREAVMAATTRRPFGDAPAGMVSNTIRLQRLSSPWSKEAVRIVLNAPIGVQSKVPVFVFVTGNGLSRNVILDGNEKNQLFNVGGMASLSFHWVDLINGRGINGGAICVEDAGELRFSLGEIRNCFSDAHGGAIFFNSSNKLKISAASLIDNRATGSGGAIGMPDGELEIHRSTIARNSADAYGGGLWVRTRHDGLYFVREATIVDNHAFGTGGFLQAGGIAEAYRSTGKFILEGTLIAENTAPILGWQFPNDLAVSVNSALSWHNLIGSKFGDFGITDGTQNNQIGSVYYPIAAMLSSLDYHGSATSRNYIPNPNSPAIDGGMPDSSAPWINNIDQRGKPRFVGSHADIGSVERQQFPN